MKSVLAILACCLCTGIAPAQGASSSGTPLPESRASLRASAQVNKMPDDVTPCARYKIVEQVPTGVLNALAEDRKYVVTY